MIIKTVEIGVGVVKRVRSKKVAELEALITDAVVSVMSPIPVIQAPVCNLPLVLKRPPLVEKYTVMPIRTAKSFYGASDKKRAPVETGKDPITRKPIEDFYREELVRPDNSEYQEMRKRIDGCSCKDENPPVANLDVWACLVCDPKPEPKEDEHSHIKEFIEGGILKW